MLVHPVGRENEQATGPRLDTEIELRETGFAALLDVIQVPEQHEVTVGYLVDGIEVRLEGFLSARTKRSKKLVLHVTNIEFSEGA